ncbi:hypothetical protein FRC02_000004 [Tulasnella sp. 418]|nr:hypothetical protein FRC02_000004 [Tulasnella sp. 418]
MDNLLPPAVPAAGRPTFVEGAICIPTGDSSRASYQHHSSHSFLHAPLLSEGTDVNLPEPKMRPRPSFPLHRTENRINAPTSMAVATEHTRLQSLTFKAPAHKHAHHLHSIPPREKTTRTLILDHMLWLHGRARFSQARAELGMGLNTGEEEEEFASDGEGVEVLGYGTDKALLDSAFSATSSRLGTSGNSARARALRAEADGLEKVLSAMLDQPPEDLPFDPDDPLLRDTSFTPRVQPLLPNGVRLRLAIAALVNDVFTEDTHTTRGLENPPSVPGSPPSFTSYTPSLALLSSISSFANRSELPSLPSFQTLTATAGVGAEHPAAILPPPGSIFSSIPRGAGPESPWALSSSANVRSQSFSTFGRGPSSSMSKTGGSRYPASFPLDIAESSSPAPPPRVFRAVGRSKDLYYYGACNIPTRSDERTPRSKRCARHFSIACSACPSYPDVGKGMTAKARMRAQTSIGAGLSTSGPPLRRAPFYGKARGTEARLTDLIPRFLRLSALVAVELGREARGEEWDALARMDLGKRKEPDSSSLKSDSEDESLDSPGRTSTAKAVPARPSRAWYALLAGLLTRASLQGYLVKGWRGTDPVEILLGVGLGSLPPVSTQAAPTAQDSNQQSVVNVEEYDDDEEQMFEPDEMPTVRDAWFILFGAKQASSGREAYEEYEKVMNERISEFFTISQNSVDLASHLEDLSRKYPAEPIERAALRFCEAVANWRGRPELESTLQYKARGSSPLVPDSTGLSTTLSIHSLIHQQPPPKPLIDRYFVSGRGLSSSSKRRDSTSSAGTSKRSRRNSWADAKGKKVSVGQAWLEEDEYVGPYGI